MARKRCVGGECGSLFIANLAYHDNIGVLPHHMAEPPGEIVTDLGLYL